MLSIVTGQGFVVRAQSLPYAVAEAIDEGHAVAQDLRREDHFVRRLPYV